MAARFSIGEIVKATGGIPAGTNAANDSTLIPAVSTDTRTLAPGEAFFALIGENHDAHDHLGEAADKGAALLVVSDTGKIPPGYSGAVLAVRDTLRAYQDLAAYYRQKIDPFVIAVTGSVGKTAVKDMIGCVLTEYAPELLPGSGRVYSTRGNLNNQIGLPRTILEAGEDIEILVVEMGLAVKGDIGRLCEIALPDVSVITNVGLSHRENFDSDDGILKAKYEAAACLGKGGALIINSGANGELEKLALEGKREKGFELIRIAAEGTDAAETAEYTVSETRVSEADAGISLFEITERRDGKSVPFEIPVPGAFAGENAALAAAACSRAGVSLMDSAAALRKLERTEHRLAPIATGGVLVIDDTYNASPDSAKSGLKYLKDVPALRRVAVLADMNELGGDSESLHRDIGEAAVLSGADCIFAYGGKARRIADGAKEAADGIQAADGRLGPEVLYYGPDAREGLIDRLMTEVRKGTAFYVKGSRSMKMEEVVSALTDAARKREDEDGAA